MKARLRYYDGTSEIVDVRFAADDGSEGHDVYVNGTLVGRVRRSETRTAVTNGRSRVAIGFTVRSGWKADRVRYATVHKTRLAAVADLLSGVGNVTKETP